MNNDTRKPSLSDLKMLPDLVDVGQTGQATQSSLSRWSRPDDAQNALKGVDRDFAFHTDAEDAPWWSLTFETPLALQYLVLENRRLERFRHLADHLVIEAETTSGVHILQDTVQRFGTEADDSALVISLAGLDAVIRITITAHTRGKHFHLSRIRVLAEASDIPQSDVSHGSNEGSLPMLIANRADGFGERLKAMLNAMVIAQHLPGEFKFGWRTMSKSIASWHDVLPVEETFSQNFRDLYFETHEAIQALILVRMSDSAIAASRTLEQNYLVSQARLEVQCPSLVGSAAAYAACFERIEFTPHLERARIFAQSVDLSGPTGCAALHLRAGDIVFGRYRKMGRYHKKASPFPVAESIAADMQAEGRPLVIFGQDRNFIEYLVERYGAISAVSLAHEQGFDSNQQALFDICLMARCDDIICGSSGFANLACWIGGITSTNPYRYYNQDKTLRLLEDVGGSSKESDPRIADLQKSFAIWLAFIISDRKIADTPQYMHLLDRAITLDPENEFFKIVKACSFIHAEDYSAAESLLGVCVQEAHTCRETLGILNNVNPDGSSTLSDYHVFLEQAAGKGYPMAALYLALSYRCLGNAEQSACYAALYHANKGDLDTPLEAALAAV